jgi:hypothetical protein
MIIVQSRTVAAALLSFGASVPFRHWRKPAHPKVRRRVRQRESPQVFTTSISYTVNGECPTTG